MAITVPSNPPLIKPRFPSAGGLSSRGVDEDFNQLLDRSNTQGSNGGGSSYIPTDDPFTSLARMELSENPYEFYKVCMWLSVNSLVHKAYVFNMSSLPMTDVRARARRRRGSSSASRGGQDPIQDSPRTQDFQDFIDKGLKLASFNKRVARVYHTYSAAVAMIRFPFVKNGTCSKCARSFPIKSMSSWSLSGSRFHGECPLCGVTGAHEAHDHYMKQASKISLFCPEMTDIRTLKRGPASDEVDVYYLIPQSDARRILSGEKFDQDFVLETPQPFLEAVSGGHVYAGWGSDRNVVRLRPDHCYLLRSPHTACAQTGLPFPSFLASFEPTWLTQVLGKATQAICKQYAVPLVAMYPETSSRSNNLFEMINVGTYMQVIQREMEKHAIDQTYRIQLPFPLGSQVIGGEAKSVFYAQEARVVMEQTAASLNCPLEFIFGGLSYSGSDVSVNNVEKQMSEVRGLITSMDQWAVDAINDFMEWEAHDVDLRPFSLGSDLPKNQFIASLVSANQLPSKLLHESMGHETSEVQEGIIKDVLFEQGLNRTRMENEARVQAEMGVQQATAQAEGQIEGQYALITGGVDLADRIRSAPTLYAYVMKNPQLAAQIFGGAPPPQGPAYPEGEAPGPVDPSAVAPGGTDTFSEESAGVDPEGLRQLVLSGESLLNAEGPEEPGMDEGVAGLVSQLVMAFEDIDPVEWPAGIQAVTQDYGADVAREVNAHLQNVRAMQGQRATRAAGVRDEVDDYGNPGVA